tara:strand:+ start:415 stop:660 length:246 start_codon:yes stop_codon:yes gene_type:complete
MTLTELKERKRTLAMGVDALALPIAEAPEGYQSHLIEVQERLYDLWDEASDELARALSEAPRQAAEARLAHHIYTDTLDLY